uniref:CSON007469 protein n=1 Tax=Culicoides sonorensis TaxID=179676 RepID=A0A336LY85_CULSO
MILFQRKIQNFLILSSIFIFLIVNFIISETNGMSVTDHHATLGQFPYMIYLTILKSENNSFACGGSVLTKNYGLTAAHCLTFEKDNQTELAESAHAFMGIVDLEGPEEMDIYRLVSEMIVHEKYQLLGDADFAFNDIALIKFEYPIEFCDRVQPITLPRADKHFTRLAVIEMGWGMTASGLTSDDLLFATSRVIDNRKCQRKYLRSQRIEYDITDKMLCVVNTKDSPRGGACFGDSGGPLVLKNTTTIVGIASWAEVNEFNCTKIYPDVFTRVTKYLDWIEEKVGISINGENWPIYGTNMTNTCNVTLPIEDDLEEVISMLTKNYGLTAAHCLTFEKDNQTELAESAHAFMGIVDLQGPEDMEMYRRVSEMIIHEKYQIFGDADYTFNDIALIKFEYPIEFCDRVQPITLPRGDKDFTHHAVIGMGWGMTASGFTSTDLLFATSRVIDNRKCQRKYLRSQRIEYDITDKMLCVVNTKDSPRGGACMGDSGGPLVLKNTTTIVGIASWTELNEFNCTKIYPDVFTRVTEYLDWIEEKVGISINSENWPKYGTNLTNICNVTLPIEDDLEEVISSTTETISKTKQNVNVISINNLILSENVA